MGPADSDGPAPDMGEPGPGRLPEPGNEDPPGPAPASAAPDAADGASAQEPAGWRLRAGAGRGSRTRPDGPPPGPQEEDPGLDGRGRRGRGAPGRRRRLCRLPAPERQHPPARHLRRTRQPARGHPSAGREHHDHRLGHPQRPGSRLRPEPQHGPVRHADDHARRGRPEVGQRDVDPAGLLGEHPGLQDGQRPHIRADHVQDQRGFRPGQPGRQPHRPGRGVHDQDPGAGHRHPHRSLRVDQLPGLPGHGERSRRGRRMQHHGDQRPEVRPASQARSSSPAWPGGAGLCPGPLHPGRRQRSGADRPPAGLHVLARGRG